MGDLDHLSAHCQHGVIRGTCSVCEPDRMLLDQAELIVRFAEGKLTGEVVLPNRPFFVGGSEVAD